MRGDKRLIFASALFLVLGAGLLALSCVASPITFSFPVSRYGPIRSGLSGPITGARGSGAVAPVPPAPSRIWATYLPGTAYDGGAGLDFVWPDSSGNGRDLIQSTEANKPIIAASGAPYLEFDGQYRWLEITAFPFGDRPTTVLWRSSHDDYSFLAGRWVWNYSESWPYKTVGFYYYSTLTWDANAALRFFNDTDGADFAYQWYPAGFASYTKPVVYGACYDTDDNCRPYISGTQLATAALITGKTASWTAYAGTGKFSVGAVPGVGAQHAGKIHWLQVLSDTPTSPELASQAPVDSIMASKPLALWADYRPLNYVHEVGTGGVWFDTSGNANHLYTHVEAHVVSSTSTYVEWPDMMTGMPHTATGTWPMGPLTVLMKGETTATEAAREGYWWAWDGYNLPENDSNLSFTQSFAGPQTFTTWTSWASGSYVATMAHLFTMNATGSTVFYHAVTFDGGSVRTYVDGVLVDAASASVPILGEAPFVVAGRRYGLGSPLAGRIHWLQVFGCVLSDDVIALNAPVE